MVMLIGSPRLPSESKDLAWNIKGLNVTIVILGEVASVEEPLDSIIP